MKNKLKIIFTGGGSGGHTMPAVSIISSLKIIKAYSSKDIDILYIGSFNGVEKNIIKSLEIPYKSISTGKLRRYFSIKNFFDIFNIILGIMQSFFIIKSFNPDIIVSTGGFVSIPPVISGKFLKAPILIHEQTINAGLANIIAAKFADIVALTFPDSKKYFNNKKTAVTGLPMREDVLSGNRKSAFKNLGINPELPVVYFTGGGLGCHLLNTTALVIIEELLSICNIIYQSGENKEFNDYARLSELKKNLPEKLKKRFLVFDFIKDELKDIYAAADLAVSRSGAGTVCELASMHIPAIYIPLAIATKNEQYKNARSIEEKGGAVIIEENKLSPILLKKTVTNLISSKQNKTMKKNLSKAKIINGTNNIIKLIFELAKQRQ